jgi:coproporphyrinogen III oxidase
MNATAAERVTIELQNIQARLCAELESADGSATFLRDAWERKPDDASGLSGRGQTAVLEGGTLLERAGVALSDVSGSKLPPAATARNPQLAGQRFRAMGVSVVIHPRNPHVPTSHMNVRYFSAGDVWWFGGGFDLTPYIPYEEDIVAWHRAASAACANAATGFHARPATTIFISNIVAKHAASAAFSTMT